MPSYSRCASIMVFFTVKRSLRAASCCSLLVVNGGTGLRFFSLVTTDSTMNVAPSRFSRMWSASSWFCHLSGLALDLGQPALRTAAARGLRASRCNRPILFRLERQNLAFALDDQAQRNGLHAAGGNSAADFVPQQRADLIAHQPIENAPRLLRVDDVLIDPAGIFDGGLIAFGVISLKSTRKDQTYDNKSI